MLVWRHESQQQLIKKNRNLTVFLFTAIVSEFQATQDGTFPADWFADNFFLAWLNEHPPIWSGFSSETRDTKAPTELFSEVIHTFLFLVTLTIVGIIQFITRSTISDQNPYYLQWKTWTLYTRRFFLEIFARAPMFSLSCVSAFSRKGLLINDVVH